MLLSLFRVSGHSMLPTFKEGQIVLVSSIPYFFRKPKIGDVVVVNIPQDKKSLLKRITKIENKKYFIVGDNSKDSIDSRSFGAIDRKYILGKVIDK